MSTTQTANDRHAYMIDDIHRTKPLLQAIKTSITKDTIVLDIGTGLGILAIHAAKCGAKKVYAIEYDSDAFACAKQNANEQGVDQKITFLDGLSFDIELPEKVDLILCEIVGSFAYDENILLILDDAKKRFLKSNGRIIPNQLTLMGALIDYIPPMDEIKETGIVSRQRIISNVQRIMHTNLYTYADTYIHNTIALTATCDKKAKALAVWPIVQWAEDCITNASPYKPLTHWHHGILPLEVKPLKKGQPTSIELIIEPHPENPFMFTERLWRWA